MIIRECRMMRDRPASFSNPQKGDEIEIYQKPGDMKQDFRKVPCTFIKSGKLTDVRYYRSHHAPTVTFVLDDDTTYTFGGGDTPFCYRKKDPDPDDMFEFTFQRFYHEHYSDGSQLESWVDKEGFKMNMRKRFRSAYIEARSQKCSKIHDHTLTHPLISNMVDPGAGDAYAYYFENDKPGIEIPVMSVSVQRDLYESVQCGDKSAVLLRKGQLDEHIDLKGALMAIMSDDDKDNGTMVRIDEIFHTNTVTEMCQCVCEIAPHVNEDEAEQSLLAILNKDGQQIFSPKSIEESGGLCAIYFTMI